MNVQEQKELERIYDRDDSLDPKVIVNEARNPTSPLHGSFTWDDSVAAEQHRLAEARRLIRVAVTIIPKLNNEPVRTYVSLTSLRKQEGQGSYIAMVDIMSDDDRYAQAREDALKAMGSVKKRFNHILELQPVWDALALVLAEVHATKDAA